jgi:hypothetical protein
MRGLGTSRRCFAAPGPLSRNERANHGLVLIATSRAPCDAAPAATPTPNGLWGAVQSGCWAISQTKHASSRATATATVVRFFARAVSRCAHRRCSRSCARQAASIAAGG